MKRKEKIPKRPAHYENRGLVYCFLYAIHQYLRLYLREEQFFSAMSDRRMNQNDGTMV